VAESGRPGPVIVVIPEDMLADETGATALAATRPHAVAPSSDTMATVAAALKAAKKPLVIVGRMGWNTQAVADFTAFAERHGLPVATAFRAKDCFDNNHLVYAGELGLGPNPALATRAREADLVLAIGLRLDENTMSGYSLLAPPGPKQTVIHIAPSPDVLSLVYQPAHAIIADTPAFNEALNALGDLGVNWHDEVQTASASHADWTARVDVGEGVNLSHAFTWMTKTLPADAILTNGAGNFAAWLHRYHRHRRLGTQLAPISGAMGFGVPAAVAAALYAPEKTVVCVAGDGDFLMSGQELATAAAYGANLIVIVVDNQAYGTIRMHQEREYPGRVSGTQLASPDFAAYGAAFGFPSWTVSTTDEFAPAFEAARAAGRGVLHVKTSVNEILPGRRL
jgi:acetolactate synthase I/II/III large subunit